MDGRRKMVLVTYLQFGLCYSWAGMYSIWMWSALARAPVLSASACNRKLKCTRLYISQRGQFGILSPHASFVMWLFPLQTQIVPKNLTFKLVREFKLLRCIEMNGLKYSNTPQSLWTCAISDAIDDFMGNIYISITRSSSSESRHTKYVKIG